MVTFISPVQSENAEFPIEVTEFGIVTSVRLEHPAKAEPPIVLTELPKVTMALTEYIVPLYVTVSGIVTVPL